MSREDPRSTLKSSLARAVGAQASTIDRLVDAVAEASPELVHHAERALREPTAAQRATLLPQLVLQLPKAPNEGAQMAVLDALADVLADVAGDVELAALQASSLIAARALLRKVMSPAGGYPRAVASTAARALAVSRDPEFLDKVRASLTSPNLAEVRLAACMAGFGRDRAAVEALIALLVPDNAAILDAVIFALGEIGSREALPMLHFLLETYMYTAQLADALGKIGDESSLAPLLGVLVAADEDTRSCAAQAIVRVIRANGGRISEELAAPARAILERVIDADELRLSKYFAIVAYALLGGRLQANRVLASLGAVMPEKDLGAMTAFFVNRGR